MTECYISVDIETAGPIVGRHSMLAIGACAVDSRTRRFSAKLRPISAEGVPEALEVVGQDLAYFEREGCSPDQVMREFGRWIKDSAGSSKPVFVGFNASFDWAFVNWYFLTYVGENPFGIGALDVKAYYAGLSGSNWDETRSSQLPEEFRPAHRHTHNALDDAVEQAEMFTRMRDHVARKGTRLRSNGVRRGLEKRENAANLQATQHAWLRDYFGVWNAVLTIAALLLTASLLPLSLVSDDLARQAFRLGPLSFRLMNAIIAFFAFSFVLIQLVWKPGTKYSAHANAVNHFTRAKFGFRTLLERDDILDNDVALVEAKYLDIRDLPSIPEKWFLPLKQWHEKKICLSRLLSGDSNTRVPRPWWWLR